MSNMSQIAERGWWMDAMTVCPIVASSCMCSITFSAAKLSRPEHGRHGLTFGHARALSEGGERNKSAQSRPKC